MRCPRCDADNPDEAVRCARCGRRLARRPAARDSDSPFTPGPDPRDPVALNAYRLSVVGLVPFLGLLFGPLGLLFGLFAWVRDRQSRGPAVAAMLLGLLSALTNWVGLLLMISGLRSGS